MMPVSLLEDYLIDQEEGLKKLLTWFLDLVMQLEAVQQAEQNRMRESNPEKRIEWLQGKISEDAR